MPIKNTNVLPVVLSLLAFAPAALAQKAAADNSSQNAKPQVTADHQTNAKSDRLATAHIRRALMKDKSLSTYAHNVKIVVKGGQTTLSGAVHTEDEKAKVASDAATVVDAGSITNDISVKQSK